MMCHNVGVQMDETLYLKKVDEDFFSMSKQSQRNSRSGSDWLMEIWLSIIHMEERKTTISRPFDD
jgi:hypothetical protein